MGQLQRKVVGIAQSERLLSNFEPHKKRETGPIAVLFDDREAAEVWRLFGFNWRLLAIATGVLNAGLVTTEFYIEPSGYVVTLAIVALYCRMGRLNAESESRRNPRVSYALIATAQMILAMSVMT